jgi:hypothetical protein
MQKISASIRFLNTVSSRRVILLNAILPERYNKGAISLGKFSDFYEKKELLPEHRDVKLEKNDFLAMFLAICWITLPILLGIFAVFALIIWLFF